VFDYGICLKLNDGLLLVNQLFKMLKLHLCLDMKSRGGAYSQSIVMQILVVLYQRKHKLPSWLMLKSQPTLFNEEAGEMTFSQLARSVVGDTQQRKFEHMNRLYKLLHIYGDVEIDTLADVKGSAIEACSRKKINPKGDEVEAVTAFMKSRIREIRHQRLTEYDGKELSWKHKVHALGNLKPLKAKEPFMNGDMMPILDLNIEKAQNKFMNTDWAGDYTDIWPECEVPPNGLPGKNVYEDFSDEDNYNSSYQAHLDKDKEYVPDPTHPDADGNDMGFKHSEGISEIPHSGEDEPAMKDQEDDDGGDSSSESHDDAPRQEPPQSDQKDPRQIPPTYCQLDEGNIVSMTRRERTGRGHSMPHPNFPMVRTSTPAKRRRK
jgi:hypothetical protein